LGDVAGPGGGAADAAALHVGRAEGIRAGARLGWVAATDGGTADGAGGDEVVGRAVVPLPVAALGDVARACRRATDRRALRVGGRAVVAHPVAALRDVAHVGGGATDRRALHVRRAARTCSGAALDRIAGPGRGTTHHERRREAVGRAIVVHPIAELRDVAHVG